MTIILILLILWTIVTISILWPHLRGAPWVPSEMKVVHQMLSMAQVGEGDMVYDLGCGDGRLLITAVRHYNAKGAVGIEIDPLRYLWCQMVITVLGLRGKIEILFGDFFKHDLSQADVVTCYLLQDTNNKLEKKFMQELKHGTRVISHAFSFQSLHSAGQDGEAMLYLYYDPQIVGEYQE